MFNFKYNIINFFKITLSFLNMVLMLRLFGISEGSDIYLLAYSIILSWHFIPLFFMGQFIQFYNDLKEDSCGTANNFYNQTLIYSLSIGLILFLICYIFLNPLVHLYTHNINPAKLLSLVQILKIMIFSIIFAPVVSLTEQLFIAEKKILHSYILQIIILLGTVLTMAYLILVNNPSIKILAVSYSVSIFISALYGFLYCAKRIIPFKFVLTSKNFVKFIRNSFATYFGFGIFNCFFPLVLNNFLVNFSNGIISCFYYSKNTIEAVNMVTVDYTNRNITSDLSIMIAKKEMDKIKQIIKKYLLFSPLLFGVVSFSVFIAIPVMLKLVFYKTGFSLNEKMFANIFLSLVPWYIIFIISCPFSYINILGKKSYAVIIANSFFVGTTATVLFLSSKELIYNISFAMFLAQITVFIIYWCYSKKTLINLSKE